MSGQVITFPHDKVLERLPTMGARMGVHMEYYFRQAGLIAEMPDTEWMGWNSLVLDHSGQVWSRMQMDGLPTKHYKGEVGMHETAALYAADMLVYARGELQRDGHSLEKIATLIAEDTTCVSEKG